MKSISKDEWLRLQKPKRNKFHAKRTIFEGQTFPSRLEAQVYAFLLALEKSGAITGLCRYGSVKLSDAGISYKPDFSFVTKGQRSFVEAKGCVTDRWRLVRKLWAAYGPGPLEVYKKNAKGIYLDETIIPKGNS